MIQLSLVTLPHELQEILQSLQQTILENQDFQDQVASSKTLWKTKGGTPNQAAFAKIKALLEEMCVPRGICPYCEQSEAFDIEHINPKSFYPERTFDWENYLLACKTCNTGYKLDACWVLTRQGELAKVNRGDQPPAGSLVAFINPRTENPEDYLYLNTSTFTFGLLPDLPDKDQVKADKTLEILALNQRDVLIQQRENVYRQIFDSLSNLAHLIEATTLDELQQRLSPRDSHFDFSKGLPLLKEELIQARGNYITFLPHPSVWSAIKRFEANTTPAWQQLFARIPQALNW